MILPPSRQDTTTIPPDTLTAVMTARRKDALPYTQDTGLLSPLRKSSPEGQKENSRRGIGDISIRLPGRGAYDKPDTAVKKEAAPPITAEAIRKQPAASNPQQKTTHFPETAGSGQEGITDKGVRKNKSAGAREHSAFFSNWFRRPAGGIRNGGDGPRPGLAPFAGAGISLEESFIVNGHLQAGMPFLYGIMTWGAGRNASGLRYGAGTSLRMGDDWRLHLQGTTGRMQFDYDSSGYLQKHVRMQWHKLALLAERRLTNRLGVQAGLSLNILNTEYYTFKDLAPLGRPEETALMDVRYFKPLYTLSNNFDPDEPRSRKMWIGVQLGVFYRLDFRKPR